MPLFMRPDLEDLENLVRALAPHSLPRTSAQLTGTTVTVVDLNLL